MPTITFADKEYQSNPEETVLECLTRHGVNIASSCRNGVCQTCLMKVTAGTPPKEAQQGLKPQLQAQGYFLACVCIPEQDLTVAHADDNTLPKTAAAIIDKQPLNEKIMRVRLQPDQTFTYRPGQFLNLYRPDSLIRSYSIASVPEQEPFVELHIEQLPGGKMSSWVHNELTTGDRVEIDGPHGECFYATEDLDKNILLLGTGSGLAPLWGILRDALNRGHRGKIHLFHGVRELKRLYLEEELKEIAAQHENFHFTPCISAETSEDYYTGRATTAALELYPDLTGWQIFLCGIPEMVKDMKKRGFLAGASLEDIHADPFIIQS